MINVDIGDLCTHCGRDTSFGSGLFVDRIPSSGDGELFLADTTLNPEGPDVTVDVGVEGYMCHECQRVECDQCEKPTLDYHMVDGSVFCSDCFKAVWGHKFHSRNKLAEEKTTCHKTG